MVRINYFKFTSKMNHALYYITKRIGTIAFALIIMCEPGFSTPEFPNVDPSIANESSISVICACIKSSPSSLLLENGSPLIDQWKLNRPFFVKATGGPFCHKACSVVGGRCVSGIVEIEDYSSGGRPNSRPDVYGGVPFVGPISAWVTRVSTRECK